MSDTRERTSSRSSRRTASSDAVPSMSVHFLREASVFLRRPGLLCTQLSDQPNEKLDLVFETIDRFEIYRARHC